MTRSANTPVNTAGKGPAAASAASTYEIRVAGHLDDHWAATLGDLTLVRLDDGTTSLTGPVLDQAHLHGVLAGVRDVGVPLLGVRTLDPGEDEASITASRRGVRAWGAAVLLAAQRVLHPGEGVRAWGGAVQLGAERVVHPGRWLWLRAMAWLLLLFFVTGLAFGLPLQWAADHLPADDAGWGLLGTLVACASALAAYSLAVRFGEGRAVCELAPRPAIGDLAVGVVLGLVMMTALMAALAAAGLYDISSSGTGSAWTGLSLAMQAAVTEELWTRALVFRLLWRAFGPLPALLVSALAFAALHLSNPGATLLSAATVAAAGLMFCGLYALTGRLWLPIGVHFAWNLAQGSLFGATVSGGDLGGSVLVSTPRAGVPGWWTGASFGPEASILALVLVGLVAALTIRAARRPIAYAKGQRVRHA